jgi:hypothetical protein
MLSFAVARSLVLLFPAVAELVVYVLEGGRRE